MLNLTLHKLAIKVNKDRFYAEIVAAMFEYANTNKHRASVH